MNEVEVTESGQHLAGPITRQQLFDMVWEEPMTKVSARFGVSSSYLARICSRLHVPRPARGYWAKLEVGKAAPRPRLSDPEPGHETTWNPGGGVGEIHRGPPHTKSQRKKKESAMTTNSQTVAAEEDLPALKEIFTAGRQSYHCHFLKPSKRNLPDIIVTKEVIERALQLAHSLFRALEKRGHKVVLASHGEPTRRPEKLDVREKPTKQPFYDDLWSPGRLTVAYIRGAPIGLTVFELTESTTMVYLGGKYIRADSLDAQRKKKYAGVSWESIQDVPSGRLALRAYASCFSEHWEDLWVERQPGEFDARVDSLVRHLEHSSPAVRRLMEVGRVKHEEWKAESERQFRRWEEEERERKRQKRIAESKSELLALQAGFERQEAAERFLQYLEGLIRSADQEKKVRLEFLLQEARTLVSGPITIESFLAWRPPHEL